MNAPSEDARRQADAVADLISRLVEERLKGTATSDKNRWLAERTSLGKDSWNRTLTHRRVIDYADIVEAASALGTTAAKLASDASKGGQTGRPKLSVVPAPQDDLSEVDLSEDLDLAASTDNTPIDPDRGEA